MAIIQEVARSIIQDNAKANRVVWPEHQWIHAVASVYEQIRELFVEIVWYKLI